jgi:hypothetical protein
MNPIDLDKETIELDGGWLTRDQLVEAIKVKLSDGRYDVARQAGALEQLTRTLSELRPMTVRVTAEIAEALTQAAARSGQSEASIIRQALMAHLTRADEVAPVAAAPGIMVRPVKSPAPIVRPR